MIGKTALFRIHKYCGLAAALVLLVQAITGMALVYGADIAQWLDPAGLVRNTAGSDASPGQLLAAAEANYPGFRVQRLVYPAQPDATYFVHMADARGARRYVSLDPGNAEILRDGSVWSFPVEAALLFHDQLMAGKFGMALVTLAGFVLLCLGISGMIVWWPKRGRIRKSLAIQWHLKARLVLRQLHRSTGVVVAIILGFSTVTGLFMSIPMLIEESPEALPRVGRSIAPAIDGALALARREFPGHAVRDIRMPGPRRLNVFFNAPERNSRAVHLVSIDLPAHRVTMVRHARAHKEPWVIALPLHTGQALGAAGRVLILLGGFALALLAASGPILWYQASRMKRRAPARPAPAKRSAI